MREYEVITYETGPRTCDRCHKMWPISMLNQYPKIKKNEPPREVCDKCLKIDKTSGLHLEIMTIWNRYLDDYSKERGLSSLATTTSDRKPRS